MWTPGVIITLILVGTIGHLMALLWFQLARRGAAITQRSIYDLPYAPGQLARELKNSIHAPIHAVMLAIFFWAGFFHDTTLMTFLVSAILTTIWAEIWHYASHRAFHLRPLHWIHAEHHRSRVNSPFTAISFSFWEKLIFDIGLLVPLALVDHFLELNLFGIALWFFLYQVINSFSHANFELKGPGFNRTVGKLITSTTYHSLHHSRYTGNYGLGTRVLDRTFGTEWMDYERLYDRIVTEQRPLLKLRERVE